MKLLKSFLLGVLSLGLIPSAYALDFSDAFGSNSIEDRLRIYRDINNQIALESEVEKKYHYEEEEEEEEHIHIAEEQSLKNDGLDYVLISPKLEYVSVEEEVSNLNINANANANEMAVSVDRIDDKDKDENEGLISGLWSKFKHNTSQTWSNPTNYSLTIPFYAWHNRLTYDKEKYEKYNETAIGIGFSMVRYDEDDDWHALYAMIFEDSNHHPETMFGYAYQKRWYFNDEHDWFAGAGFTLGLTQRCEYSYIPIPVPLPLVSFGHRKFNLNMAYVPGIKNDGNVAFFFTNVEF